MQTLSKDTSMDEKNASAGFMPKNAEENYEYNSKSLIPKGMEIDYIDGNVNNWKFSNLTLVVKRGDKKNNNNNN